MKGFFKEFREFAFKGNMIDLAVGMIIGSAFTALVKDLVDDLVMPLISLITGKIDFENMFIPLAGQSTKVYAEAVEQGAVLAYGSFITAVINFLIMALVVFLMVKQTNKLRRLNEKKEDLAEAAEPTEKECPYCKSMIPVSASRCPHCTSKLAGYTEL